MDQYISEYLNINRRAVSAVLELLNEGSTIPFIARYRKELTGSLDEVAIEKIDTEHKNLVKLEKRKETIFDRLKELNITDDAILRKIKQCQHSVQLEDLYLPYKPKRKTRASIAHDAGLEPFAKIIMAQKEGNLRKFAQRYTKQEFTEEAVFQGARDIISEWISEKLYARNQLRRMYQNTGELVASVNKKKEEEAFKYKDYFSFNQLLKRIPSHRLLAIFRAEKEGFLKVKIEIDQEAALSRLQEIFIKSNGEPAQQISLAINDSFKRLLSPSLENEIRKEAKEKADKEAIEIFSNNLRQLLLAAPLGAKAILALDPGFRTGCKLVCLNKLGDLEYHTTIYPHPPQRKLAEAENVILQLIEKYQIKAIAIGNGTAGRETQQFIKEILPTNSSIDVYLISEAGASIYSASENGRNEFPDLDITVRGSISIGRRLLDPLSELVKIDPKSIGVGQYQHDVAQDKLKASLDNTVSFAVNKVGVNGNTASQHLLQYIAGIGPTLAKNIVEHREVNGPFKTRKSLLKVKGLGAKAFEQSAGFIKIPDGEHPLDNTSVHPESYSIVSAMALKSKTKIEKFVGNKELIESIKLQEFVSKDIGIPTLKDIITELKKPGLDPRGKAKSIQFDENIRSIDDLRPSMVLQGKVTNLTKFGAFVDIGIKENGLIHKSQIANRFIEDPAEVLRLDQEVKVKVLEVDLQRKRIQLSMKDVN